MAFHLVFFYSEREHVTSHSRDYLLTIGNGSSSIGMIYFHQRDIIHRDLKSSNGVLYLHIQ